MEIEVLSYKVESVSGIPMQYYLLSNPDEDIFVTQLESIKSLKGFEINELLVKVLDNGVLDYEKNVIKYPRLGLKIHVSQAVNDKRYGTVLKEHPVDLEFWLDN